MASREDEVFSDLEYKYFLKYVFIGNAATGKSSILSRYSDNQYEETYSDTQGAGFKSKFIKINNEPIKLQIWDTPGQEKYRTVTSLWYQKAYAVFLTLSFKQGESIETFKARAKSEVTKFMSEIEIHAEKNLTVFLVINQIDRINLSEDEKPNLKKELLAHAQPVAKDTHLHENVFLVSAKTGAGINELFDEANHVVLKKLENGLSLLFATGSHGNNTDLAKKEKKLNGFVRFFKGLFGVISGLLGIIVGGVLGIVAAIVVYNPLALFFDSIQKGSLLKAIFSPVGTIFVCLIKLVESMGRGWDKEFLKSFTIPLDILLQRNGDGKGNKSPIATKHIIAAWLITALTAAVVLSIVFPPVALALILPKIIATIGLTGFSTAVIAVIAGISTAVFSSAIYGLGYNIGNSVTAKPASDYRKVGDQASSYRQSANSDDQVQDMSVAVAIGLKSIPPFSNTPIQEKFVEGTLPGIAPSLRLSAGCN